MDTIPMEFETMLSAKGETLHTMVIPNECITFDGKNFRLNLTDEELSELRLECREEDLMR